VSLLPYALFNGLAFGRPLPTPPAGAWGNSLYTATWEPRLEAADLDSWYSGPSPALLSSGLIAEVRRINGTLGVDLDTPPFTSESYPPHLRKEAARVYAREAWTRITDRPAEFALHAIRRLWRLWNTQYQPRRLPAIFATAAGVAANLVWLLGGLGALLIASRWAREPGLLAMPLVVLYLSALHACLHTEARYTAAGRLPLAFCATVLVSAAVRRRASSDRSLTDEQQIEGTG